MKAWCIHFSLYFETYFSDIQIEHAWDEYKNLGNTNDMQIVDVKY